MDGALFYVEDLLVKTLEALAISLSHNWKILLFAILLAVVLKTYVNSEKLSKILFERKKISIFASVLFGTFTPLCACGTTAVIIGMLTTSLPWSPIMAFLTSSPLMSPDGFILISGVIGLNFAIALTVASVIIGLSSGFITNVIEKKTDFFKNQSRFMEKEKAVGCGCKTTDQVLECGCNSSALISEVAGSDAFVLDSCSCDTKSQFNGCSCDTSIEYSECSCDTSIEYNGCACGTISNNKKLIEKEETLISKTIRKFKLKEFLREFWSLGLKQILFFYSIFICIGFLINHFIPASIITVLFGTKSLFAVPLASIIGLPLYITTDSGIPIIKSMIDSGASQGAMLAFMITGSATSAWVIAGLTTFMKKRAIMLYVAYVFFGGIIAGYVFDLINLFL